MQLTLKIKVSLALEVWLEAPRNDFWAAWGQSLVGLCGLSAGAGWIMLVSLDAHAPIKAPIAPQAPLGRYLRALSPPFGGPEAYCQKPQIGRVWATFCARKGDPPFGKGPINQETSTSARIVIFARRRKVAVRQRILARVDEK